MLGSQKRNPRLERHVQRALGSQRGAETGREQELATWPRVLPHTCADMLTVSTDHWLEGKDCRTLWAMEVFPVPTGPTSSTGFWLATMVLTR